MTIDFDKAAHSDIRTSASKALAQLLEPLAGFVSDSGLSTNDLCVLYKEAAVRNAAAKQLEVGTRINISGIAATTGISRADISRILKVREPPSRSSSDRQQQSTNRILVAWHDDPKFIALNGQPADLDLYGRGITFEALAKKYGRGIPTRAVLDELHRAGAVELLENQKLRVKATVAIERGMSAQVIRAFGDRAAELLSTMLLNMREPKSPRFISSVTAASVPVTSLPLFRRELLVKGSEFLAEVREASARKSKSHAAKRRSTARVSVTVFYHEMINEQFAAGSALVKRKNFKREA